MVTCEENASILKAIFEDVLPGDNASRLERYTKAVQRIMPGKKRNVEDLMKEMLEKSQLLHTNHFFQSAGKDITIEAAIQQLSKVQSSLPDEPSSPYASYVAGSLNVNPNSGTMYTYAQTGSSGKMFNLASGSINFNVTADDW